MCTGSIAVYHGRNYGTEKSKNKNVIHKIKPK